MRTCASGRHGGSQDLGAAEEESLAEATGQADDEDLRAGPRPQIRTRDERATTSPKTSTQTTKKPRTNGPRPNQPPTTIRRIGADLYWVSSASHPGTGHQTTPHTCTCPAGRHGRRDCRHRALVRIYHAWRTAQAAQTQAAPQQTAASAAPPPRGELRPLSGYFE